jgi:hypothetical protein
VRFAGGVLLAAIVVFSVAAFVILGMRWKEAMAILPLVATFYGVGLVALYSTVRDRLAPRMAALGSG